MAIKTLSQIFGESPILRPRTTIARKTTTIIASSLNPFNGALPSTLSGAMTANQWKDLIDIAGSGVLQFAALGAQNSTSRTVDFEIILDGNTIYPGSEAIAAARWFVGVGAVTLNSSSAVLAWSFDPKPYRSTLKIRARQTDTATDSLRLDYAHDTV